MIENKEVGMQPRMQRQEKMEKRREDKRRPIKRLNDRTQLE